MTLMLIMANQQHVVLVSDRRLTRNGQLIEDESNKAAVFICRAARLAVAYAGLAQAGGFLTREWLPIALMESVAPDYLMGPTVERFRQRASRDIADIRVNRLSDKRLTVVLAGHSYNETRPRCYCWLVSNFEGLNSQQQSRVTPSAEFSAEFYRELRPTVEDPSMVLAVGAGWAPSQSDLESLQVLVRDNRPARALVDKGVEVIRATAESASSGRVIGKQCTSIVIPSKLEQDVVGEYHSATVARTLFFPSLISALGGESGVYVIAEVGFEFRDSNGRQIPLSVPKVGRNRPCPCGSGLKYKQCHGRWRYSIKA